MTMRNCIDFHFIFRYDIVSNIRAIVCGFVIIIFQIVVIAVALFHVLLQRIHMPNDRYEDRAVAQYVHDVQDGSPMIEFAFTFRFSRQYDQCNVVDHLQHQHHEEHALLPFRQEWFHKAPPGSQQEQYHKQAGSLQKGEEVKHARPQFRVPVDANEVKPHALEKQRRAFEDQQPAHQFVNRIDDGLTSGRICEVSRLPILDASDVSEPIERCHAVGDRKTEEEEWQYHLSCCQVRHATEHVNVGTMEVQFECRQNLLVR
mmetsp:Transcript_22960/g.65056  ORF Transcript_22960/g.65056 Transcript_22960/m.65056 type:complete len:259 (+) Transcript_22960:369-1145(+)